MNTKQNDLSRQLFEQAAQITKAHGYDILSVQVGQLKEIIRQLIDVGELEDLVFINPADTEQFQALVKKAKMLSYEFKNNQP